MSIEAAVREQACRPDLFRIASRDDVAECSRRLGRYASGRADRPCSITTSTVGLGMGLTSGLPADVVSDYASHYAKLNPWMPAASREDRDRCRREQMLPREQFVKKHPLQRLLRPMGRGKRGRRDARQRARTVNAAVDLPPREPIPRRTGDLADLLTRLAPHLRRGLPVRNGGAPSRPKLAVPVCQNSEWASSSSTKALAAINFGAQGQAMVEADGS
ncbi:hypothetical protein F2981_25000 (plasmid) [Sinorhizobium meliloti]|nr:hypothetical protein [Sinorhizobium meliloti]